MIEPYYQNELVTFYQGSCLKVMKNMESNSVDAVVTDPPYGLSFMGKKWDYDVPSVGVWEECLRVLKPGGYLLAFAGTRTQHRMAVNIEDAGFEIRDMIAWVYGSGFPKNHNIGKAVDELQGNEREVIGKGECGYNVSISKKRKEQGHRPNLTKTKKEFNLTKGNSEWEGWGTNLKPALEPITVAMKPKEGTFAENCLKWGVGGINIDDCRVGTEIMNNRPAGNKAGGNSLNMSVIGMPQDIDETTSQGRFPANLIHDGSDEVVSLFPDSSKDNRYDMGGTSASRFFYCAKASKKERNLGCEELETKKGGSYEFRQDGSSDGKIPSNKNNHPTVKPVDLMEYLVKLVSREGAIVLDPFAGSGTTGLACINLKRNCIGIEKEEKYCEIIKKRCEHKRTVLTPAEKKAGQMTLFEDEIEK